MNAKGYSLVIEPVESGFINTNGYLIVIEPTAKGFSAFCPDLEGCISVGKTVEQTKKHMLEAIELYLEELSETGEKIPEPKNFKNYINVLENSRSDAYLAFIPIQASRIHAKTA